MTATTSEATGRRTKQSVIDCDIHNALPSDDALSPYLSTRWRRHRAAFGNRGYPGTDYPRMNESAARVDAWPPSGSPPGSDLEFLREQLLDLWGIEYGVLNPLVDTMPHNLDYAAAFCAAVNDWQVAEWLEPEPRLRASLVVPYEDGELAAAEIRRSAGTAGFVQVLLLVRTNELLGRRRYWKMYEAAAEHDLPIGIHFGWCGGFPTTGAGFPSFYLEEHCGMATAFQDQIVSLVCEGVFDRFPTLKIVSIEGGFAWLVPLMWRFDRSWKLLRSEVPHLTEPPSSVIRRHFWVTTQPIEEPPRRGDFEALLEQLGMNDRLLFATDYPHWDFDAPDAALPRSLEPAVRDRIFAENARALYGLPERALASS
jgi:predicted TIM-barrel fold metal-dependent hydrolase